MQRSYSYALLQAVPDKRRGERVNVGVVILTPTGVDIRVHETRKLRVLTGEAWDSYIKSFEAVLRSTDSPELPPKDRLDAMSVVQNQFLLSRTGGFEADDAIEYEERVKRLVDTLVARPKAARLKEDSAVVSEIAAVLRASSVLASRDEELQSGKVVRGYLIEEGLEADFAQLNSKLHVASVLDLRSDNPRLAQAALKAVTLDRAKGLHGGNVHRIGVYAVAPARRHEVRENIKLLTDYADDVVNWTDPTDRKSLTRLFFDAYNHHLDAAD